MIVFDLKFGVPAAIVSGVLWAIVAALYAYVVFIGIPNDIDDFEETLDTLNWTEENIVTIRSVTFSAHLEETFRGIAVFAWSLHIAIGVFVALQAAFFGEDVTPGVLSVTRPIGFMIRVFTICSAQFVNLFFIVAAVSIFFVSSTNGGILLAGAILSLLVNSIMITMWEVMMWTPVLNEKLL